MATPDYLQQVVVSGRRQRCRRAGQVRRAAVFKRPSVTSLVWASTLDMLTATGGRGDGCGCGCRPIGRAQQPFSMIPHDSAFNSPKALVFYLLFYGLALVADHTRFGLVRPIQNRSGLHEQRMTVQATLMAGLLLCGALYVFRGNCAMSRVVVGLLVLITTILLCVRRAIWRSRWSTRATCEGLGDAQRDDRGAGRVAHALRNHLESAAASWASGLRALLRSTRTEAETQATRM